MRSLFLRIAGSCAGPCHDFFRSNLALLPPRPADSCAGVSDHEGALGGRFEAVQSDGT